MHFMFLKLPAAYYLCYIWKESILGESGVDDFLSHFDNQYLSFTILFVEEPGSLYFPVSWRRMSIGAFQVEIL